VQLFTEIEAARERWDVLQHPFYQRWSQGELSREELATYAGQYRHAVVALAEASQRAADAAPPADGLGAHAVEEAEHVALWDAFAREVGGDADAAPTAETRACAEAWSGEGRSLSEHLVALYAIEAAQPAISETKRAGLLRFYDVDEGPATAYFDVHAELDHEHAAADRALLEQRAADADPVALAATAEAVLRANWELLDGVDALRS
jgi:pyrroloquinoline-quinone synthase